MTVKMGIPNKGRLSERAVELLVKSGIDLGEDWGRRLYVTAKNQDIEVLFVRAQDIPAFISAGAIDFGITGEDMVAESGYPLKKIADLDFGRCRLSIAAPEVSGISSVDEIPDGSRVATSFPNLTGRYFKNLGKSVKIVEVSGAAEIMPYLGVADMISDLVASGSTLKINRLVEVCRILESQAAIFGPSKADHSKKSEIMDVVDSIRSVIAAEGKKYLMANVPKTKLAKVQELLPGINGATLMEISGDPDMMAVQAVVASSEIYRVVNSLKKFGATGILTVVIDRLVE